MSKDLYDIVIKDLSYPAVYFRPGRFHKERHDYEGHSTILSKCKDGGFAFYSGLIPRIENFCKEKGIVIEEKSFPNDPVILSTKPLPEGLHFRSFQQDFIPLGIQKKRGIFICPTGTGKTILALGFIAHLWENYKILWLCHTKSLMSQSAEEAEKLFGEGSVGLVGDGEYEIGRYVTIATRQTFKKHIAEIAHTFDIVIVDECHHVSSLDKRRDKEGNSTYQEYTEILRRLYAPIRLGLTATRADSKASQLAMESLIGPVIGEFTINEAREKGYMAHPKIKLTKLDMNPAVRDLRTYADVYEKGIVRNLQRNRIISEFVSDYSKEGLTSLIIVNQIVHGELIQNMILRKGVGVKFVNGSTDTEVRDQWKQSLNQKDLKCVICTSVWKEGINIPELNVVINAAGGKSELNTLQSIGRGLRRTETKSELIIHDFFDPSHRFLIEHFGQRVCLYMDNGWL